MVTKSRAKASQQAHMEEQPLDNVEVLPYLEIIGRLNEELEEDEETKAQRKELRETNKKLKGLIKGLALSDGRYRIGQSGWAVEVTNQPGGTKEVSYGDSVRIKIEAVE